MKKRGHFNFYRHKGYGKVRKKKFGYNKSIRVANKQNLHNLINGDEDRYLRNLGNPKMTFGNIGCSSYWW